MTTLRSDLPEDDHQRGPARRTWLIAAVVTVVVVIHIAGRVGAYCSPLHNDSYVYSAFGYRIAHGDVMYRDMSDIKPPGLFMLLALMYVMLPGGRSAIVPLESLFLLLAYYVIYRLSREMFGRAAALVVVVVAVVAINYFTVMGHVIEGFGLAENFMVLPAAAAVLFYRRGLVQRRVGGLILAGMFLGWDMSIKQTALPVVAAVALHWSWSTLLAERTPRRWLAGCAGLMLGGVLAWSPLVVMMMIQGTLPEAWTLLTSDAGAMIGRGTAWPTQWRDVLPLLLPFGWCAWGALALAEQRFRSPAPTSGGMPGRSAGMGKDRLHEHGRRGRPCHPDSDLALLILWSVTELMLLAVLPLRSAHYYVATCVPFILISGVPFAVLGRSVATLSPRVRLAVWSIAIVGSTALYRPAVDRIVPCAIARYRSYDWRADDRYFKEAVNWGPIHFGRGKPWTEHDRE